MKDYSAMSDFEINKLVIESLGGDMAMKSVASDRHVFADVVGAYVHKDYCNNPADAWPIIFSEGISLLMYTKGKRSAYPSGKGMLSPCAYHDDNPLRAAMIVYLMMKDAEKGHG